jgi:glycyl-tRNA synthetase beta chain
MADFLLELLSEEIPFAQQLKVKDFVKKALSEKLLKIGLSNQVVVYVSARRVVIYVKDIPNKITFKGEKFKGPKVNSNIKAIEGFLKKFSLLDKNILEKNEINGEQYYFYEIKDSVKNTSAILPKLSVALIDDISGFWSKTMQWGSYDIKWIRPLHNILCLFDTNLISFKYGHLESNNNSFGHRFLANDKKIIIESPAAYFKKIYDAKVIINDVERKELILKKLTEIAKNHGLELVLDNELLNEVNGLVEYPHILIGEIDKEFMQLPPEILITSLKNHQKYFCTKKEGRLAPYFLFVSNNEVKTEKLLIEGNKRVLRSRLNDAKFFYEHDSKISLIERVDALENIVFHKDLGNLKEKTMRNQIIAKYIALLLPESSLVDVEVASLIAKADLNTEIVAEFPELQGVAGYYYALNDNLDKEIALAIKDHYLPRGVRDDVPKNSLAVTVALADKFDSLIALMLVGERATGSNDIYGLRRLAIGIIRIILENKLNLPLKLIIHKAVSNFTKLPVKTLEFYKDLPARDIKARLEHDVLYFIISRFKIILRDKNIPHDVIMSVFNCGDEDDLLNIINKSVVLSKKLQTVAGKKLLETYRRIHNIYKKAEKEDGVSYMKKPKFLIFKEDAEKRLYSGYKIFKTDLNLTLKRGDYEHAFDRICDFTILIDEFFTNIMVNISDNSLRQNRLKLLATICKTVNNLADFSRIEKLN